MHGLEAAKNCGYEHVGWSPAGFLGDELPSERYSNDALLKKALKDIKAGAGAQKATPLRGQ